MTESSEECEYEAIVFDILKFLAEYEQLPCLWDKNHAHFRDRKERTRCEEILGEKLGIHDSFTLRRKIRSVRGSYNQEIRKIKTCLENGNNVYPPKLFWFPIADKFLRVTTDLPFEVFPQCIPDQKVVSSKKLYYSVPVRKRKGITLTTASNIAKKLDESQEERNILERTHQELEDIEEYQDIQTLKQEEDESKDSSFSIHFETNDEFESDHNDIESESLSITRPMKIKKQEHSISNVAQYLNDISSENEFIAFGRSVGIQLKNMPLDLAVQLQMEIQSHITKTRLEYLKNTRKKLSE